MPMNAIAIARFPAALVLVLDVAAIPDPLEITTPEAVALQVRPGHWFAEQRRGRLKGIPELVEWDGGQHGTNH